MGWDEEAIRCEYAILRGEIERVIRQHARAAEGAAIDEVRAIMTGFLEEAERTSIHALYRVVNTVGAS